MPPPSMKEFNITQTGVKIDVAAIEWPANATALVYDTSYPPALVCRTADPDESKEGAETSEIRIYCNADQVIGDLSQLQLPVSMQDLNLSGTAVTGKSLLNRFQTVCPCTFYLYITMVSD